MDIEVAGEEVLYEQGTFRTVRRYLKGSHPQLGQLHQGLSGPETVVETTVIRPMNTINVEESLKKTLYINRGLPGSGKTTRAQRMWMELGKQGRTIAICSSDDFFVCRCCAAYNFDLTKLPFAHKWCQEKCMKALADGIDAVIIDNTNCSAAECRPYVLLAQQHDYEVVFLEPETPWAFDLDVLETRNVHRVPREALERMMSRWVPNMTVEKALGLKQTGPKSEDERAAA